MFLKQFNRELRNTIIIYGIGITYWLLIVFYREYHQKDLLILKKNIIFNCNGWCISHYLHYLILSYFSPSYWYYLILIGIIFEIIEIPLNKLSIYIDSKLIKDTITNTLGVLTGVILSKIFPNKTDLYNIFLLK